MSLFVQTSSYTNPFVTTALPVGVGDAFGRLRTSNPLTLFDSSHRYHDNGLWAISTATGGTSTFDANAGLVNLAKPENLGKTSYRVW